MTPVEKVIAHFGSQTALAKAIGVSQQAIQQWSSLGRISHKKVAHVAQVTGIPVQELRPDLFSVMTEVTK